MCNICCEVCIFPPEVSKTCPLFASKNSVSIICPGHYRGPLADDLSSARLFVPISPLFFFPLLKMVQSAIPPPHCTHPPLELKLDGPVASHTKKIHWQCMQSMSIFQLSQERLCINYLIVLLKLSGINCSLLLQLSRGWDVLWHAATFKDGQRTSPSCQGVATMTSRQAFWNWCYKRAAGITHTHTPPCLHTVKCGKPGSVAIHVHPHKESCGST